MKRQLTLKKNYRNFKKSSLRTSRNHKKTKKKVGGGPTKRYFRDLYKIVDKLQKPYKKPNKKKLKITAYIPITSLFDSNVNIYREYTDDNTFIEYKIIKIFTSYYYWP